MNEVNEQIAIDHGLKKEEFSKICDLSNSKFGGIQLKLPCSNC